MLTRLKRPSASAQRKYQRATAIHQRNAPQKSTLYTLLANHDLAAIEKIEDDRSASEFANDLFSADNHPDMHPSTLSRQRNALEKRVEEVGLFTVELIVNGESISAIGGFVGDDFYGSGYDDDFYREAIELLSDEYKNFIESAQAVLDVI